MSDKGGIGYDKKMGRYYVSWYHGGKTHKIWFYNGIPMHARDTAERLRSVMRGDEERGVFRIEKFINSRSEVSPFIDKWLENVISKKAPSTHDYYSRLMEKHVKPFFDARRVSLQEIDYGLLMELKFGLTLAESSQYTLFKVIKSFMLYAQKIGRIQAMPVFPGADDYNIDEKPIQWLPEDRQAKVIEAIPEKHQPIFWFLKYHLRRPAEACALHKSDFDGEMFVVHRTFSRGILMNRTKTKHITYLPCVEAYKPILREYRQREYQMSSPYFFVNPDGKTDGQHYTVERLRRYWNKACKKVGEDIQFYSGTKHSSASQLINEYWMNQHDVQLALNCSPNTVSKYAKVEVSARAAVLNKAFKTKIRKAK